MGIVTKTSAKPPSSSDALYDEKKPLYYGYTRYDLLPFIPQNVRRLLDVGCGNGDTGVAAKQLRSIGEVIGIELYEPAGKIAQTKLDRVFIGDIETLTLDFPKGYFDCILCADVIEHTKDPWGVLKKLHALLDDNGVLVASMPNIRHVRPLFKIIFDRFEYEESGLLDKTHLHLFTLHTIRKMFSETGYRIERIETTNSGRKSDLLNICTLGLLRKFLIYQFYLVVKKQ